MQPLTEALPKRLSSGSAYTGQPYWFGADLVDLAERTWEGGL